MFKLRRGRDPAARQALPQAGPGQLGRAVHRRVHVAARAAAEPARAARHRHLRRRRQRGGRLQGVHPGRVAVQREGRQAVQAALRVPHLRHGQRRLHLQRRAVPGPENDGRQQPEGHAAAADRRQDHPVRRQGRGRQDLVRGVLQRGGQHRHTQEDGGRRVGAAPRPRGETCLGFTTSAKFQGSHVAHVALLPAPHSATPRPTARDRHCDLSDRIYGFKVEQIQICYSRVKCSPTGEIIRCLWIKRSSFNL